MLRTRSTMETPQPRTCFSPHPRGEKGNGPALGMVGGWIMALLGAGRVILSGCPARRHVMGVTISSVVMPVWSPSSIVS